MPSQRHWASETFTTRLYIQFFTHWRFLRILPLLLKGVLLLRSFSSIYARSCYKITEKYGYQKISASMCKHGNLVTIFRALSNYIELLDSTAGSKYFAWLRTWGPLGSHPRRRLIAVMPSRAILTNKHELLGIKNTLYNNDIETLGSAAGRKYFTWLRAWGP